MSAEGTNEKYKSRLGLNAAGAVELHFNKIIGLNVELEFSYRSLMKERDDHQGSQQLIMTENLVHASLPVSIRFTYPGEKYYPYIYGGYSPSYTLLAGESNVRTPDKDLEQEVFGLNIKPQVSTFSQSVFFGGGIKRRFGYKYVLVDMRYRLGMTNITNEETAFDFSNEDNRIATFKYLNGRDDFRWNGIELSVGFVWPMYKPREKNTVTIQTMINRWFGKKDKKDE